MTCRTRCRAHAPPSFPGTRLKYPRRFSTVPSPTRSRLHQSCRPRSVMFSASIRHPLALSTSRPHTALPQAHSLLHPVARDPQLRVADRPDASPSPARFPLRHAPAHEAGSAGSFAHLFDSAHLIIFTNGHTCDRVAEGLMRRGQPTNDKKAFDPRPSVRSSFPQLHADTA